MDGGPRQKTRKSATFSGPVPSSSAASTSSAFAAREATLTSLVNEGVLLKLQTARAESECRLLVDELVGVENEGASLSWKFASEHEAAERLRSELRAREDEQQGLVTRLATAQRVNDEWQERVRSVSSEFEARTSEWQAQLMAADGKWRQIVETLQRRLGAANERHTSEARELQELGLEREKLEARLHAAQEDAAAQRGGARREAELQGTLAARTAELGETRAALSLQREDVQRLSTELAEARAQLSVRETEAAETAERLREQSEEAARQCEQSEADAAWIRELSVQLEETKALGAAEAEEVTKEGDELRDELTAAREELVATQLRSEELSKALAEEEQAHARTRQDDYDERERVNHAWVESSSALQKRIDDSDTQATRAAALREALQVSEAAVATMQGANAALERRAAEAEASLAVASAARDNSAGAFSTAAEARQVAEAELARAYAEIEQLRVRIRQMVEHHHDTESQAEVDAEDAAVLRDESVRLHGQLAALEAALGDEKRAKEEAQAAEAEAAAAAESANAKLKEWEGKYRVSTALVVAGSQGQQQQQMARMAEQRERLEALELELAASQAAMARMQQAKSKGGFLDEAIKTLGGAVCLGTGRDKPVSPPRVTMVGGTWPERNHRPSPPRLVDEYHASAEGHHHHHHHHRAANNAGGKEHASRSGDKSGGDKTVGYLYKAAVENRKAGGGGSHHYQQQHHQQQQLPDRERKRERSRPRLDSALGSPSAKPPLPREGSRRATRSPRPTSSKAAVSTPSSKRELRHATPSKAALPKPALRQVS